MGGSAAAARMAIALGLMLGICIAAAGPASADDATYTVVKCGELNRTLSEARVAVNPQYAVRRLCADAPSEFSTRIESIGGAGHGRWGAVRWQAPEATAFTGVRLQARLRRDAGHRSRVFMAQADGRETVRVATGEDDPTGWKPVRWDGPRQEQFVASLDCQRTPDCPQSDAAKTWIREIQLELVDYANPTVAATGTMYSGEWLTGTQRVEAQLADAGSGLTDATVQVNGSELTLLAFECPGAIVASVSAESMSPCHASADFTPVEPSTNSPPFHDGQNTVSVCAHDFAGNETCDERTVRVDNTPPTVAFADLQDPEDPELIRAVVGDATSGLSTGQISFRAVGHEPWRPLDTQLVGGELRARVDSAAEVSGEYEFMAVAVDVAGNTESTTLREDGLPKRLDFPLRSGVELTAAIKPGGSKRVDIRYGKRARVVGTLIGRDGEPLGGQEIDVVERFPDGALIERRLTTVRSNARGGWRTRLRAGPSRSVSASFAGTPRYLGAQASGGRVSVSTKASFKVSRARVPEGNDVVFKGKVRSRGARIPRGGKLLELQVRQRAGRWITVREAFRTRSSGRYRMRYRFGRFYAFDTRFRFRVKIAREADWPYRPVKSRPRSVTVLAR
jgi:hypothetical protein